MKENQPITKEQFLKRLADLCLRSGLSGFPKDEAGQHILLKSALLEIGNAGPLSEREINEKLARWCQATQSKGIDHVMLRRALVDNGYLSRSPDGSTYRVIPEGAGKFEFESSIDAIDLAAAMAAAREEIELRKRMYLEKSQKG